jgi:perosamine synthetase
MRVPLYSIHVEEEGRRLVQEAIASGALRQGKTTETFEKEFCAVFGAPHSIAVSSGTAALHLACLALFEPGDEVLVPTFSFFATASAVALAGCVPVFCDIEPDHLGIDLSDAEKRVTPKTKGMIPVHLFGVPLDCDALHAFAAGHGLRVVHDACQSHGAEWKGGNLAALGACTCYSFYPTKNLFTGEGGMITTTDAALAERLGRLRNHGMSAAYNHEELGLNYRMTDLEASIGLGQLHVFPRQLKRRRENYARIMEGVGTLPGVRWQKVPSGGTPGPSLLTGVLAPGIDRQAFQGKLSSAGVDSGVYYPRCLHQQPLFARTQPGVSCPRAESICPSVVSLPTHHALSPEQIAHLAATVREALA